MPTVAGTGFERVIAGSLSPLYWRALCLNVGVTALAFCIALFRFRISIRSANARGIIPANAPTADFWSCLTRVRAEETSGTWQGNRIWDPRLQGCNERTRGTIGENRNHHR